MRHAAETNIGGVRELPWPVARPATMIVDPDEDEAILRVLQGEQRLSLLRSREKRILYTAVS